MIELTVKAAIEGVLMTREAAAIAAKMSSYDARILLRSQNITVNAKSLMGLVSLGVTNGQAVTIIAEGPDECGAAAEVARLFGT